MAEFQGIFAALSAISIDNRGGGWDGRWGGVGRGGVGWVGREVAKTTPRNIP